MVKRESMAVPSYRKYVMSNHQCSAEVESIVADGQRSGTLAAYITPLINKLMNLHGLEHNHALSRIWKQITEQSFSLPDTLYSYAHSTINGDGLPLQISVSLSPQGSGGLRLLTEAGPLHHSIADRIEASTRILARIGSQLGLGASDQAVNAALPHLFPQREEKLAEWSGGAIWIALGGKGHQCGIKYYINMDWGSDRERWIRAGKCIAAAGMPRSSLEHWISLYETWGNKMSLEGFMFDPSAEGLKKIKVYFRTHKLEQDQLARFIHDLSDDFDYPLFLKVSEILAGRDHVWRDRSLVFSYEIDVRTWKTGCKVDMNCRDIGISDREFIHRVEKVCQLLHIDPFEYVETYRILAENLPNASLGQLSLHRFIGLGYSPGEGVRLNVYWQPPNPKWSIPQRTSISLSDRTWMLHLEKSWNEAVQYVLSMRAANGKWSDFQMPVGISDGWVTAYVTAALAEAEDHSLHSELSDTAQWLKEHFRPDHGWGYNRNVAADGDSTSWALIALQKLRQSGGLEARQLLAPYLRANRLFTTYIEDINEGESWGNGHCDVTAVALQALLSAENMDDIFVEPIVNSMIAHQRVDGGWDAFWWKDDLYTAAMAAKALSLYIAYPTTSTVNRSKAKDALTRLRSFLKGSLLPDEPFAIALWLQAWIQSGGAWNDTDAAQFWQHLLSQQQPYGGWESVPILRLSRNSQERPWEHDHDDRMYRDHNGLFTTATVISALTAYRAAYNVDSNEEVK